MLGNMLNDLAEAIRRWTEKKNQRTHKHNKQAGGKESAGKAEEDRSGVQYATDAAESDDSVT